MKNKKTVEVFSVFIEGDINMAKAVVGLCYGFGICSDDDSFETAIEFINSSFRDSCKYEYILIGGEYGIDLSMVAEHTNFDSVEEVFDHLNHVLGSNVVKLNDDYDAIIEEKGIRVGCQFFSYEKLEEVMTAAGYEFD